MAYFYFLDDVHKSETCKKGRNHISYTLFPTHTEWMEVLLGYNISMQGQQALSYTMTVGWS